MNLQQTFSMLHEFGLKRGYLGAGDAALAHIRARGTPLSTTVPASQRPSLTANALLEKKTMIPSLIDLGLPNHRTMHQRWFAIQALFLATCVLAVGCASQKPLASGERAPGSQSTISAEGGFEAQAGIQVVALRLSGNGNLLDLRYKVKDPEKAHTLLSHQAKPMLLDPTTGRKLIVPEMAYVGALRQTAVAPQEGKTYFILFGNPSKGVHTGQQLDLVLGDLTLRGLTVE
jgi:hypothetical protein